MGKNIIGLMNGNSCQSLILIINLEDITIIAVVPLICMLLLGVKKIKKLENIIGIELLASK